MKYFIVAVGVLACFLASVEAHEFNDAISALKAWTPCASGEECPPPSPCHEPFSMTKVCVFSAGVGKLLIDPQRRKEVVHSGLTALIRKIREMLSHSDQIIPGIGAVAIDIGLHTFNIIEGFNEVLGKAVDWLGRPHPIFEYLYPVFVWPLQVLASVFEGLDVAFDKSGYHGILKAWQEWIIATGVYIVRFFDALFNHTPYGRRLKEILENIAEWFRHHHDTSCRHYFPEQICHAIDLITEGVAKLFWGTITMWRDKILGVLHTISEVLDIFTFPDFVTGMTKLCYKSPIPNSVCNGLKNIIMAVHELANREGRKVDEGIEALRDWLNHHVFIDIEPL